MQFLHGDKMFNTKKDIEFIKAFTSPTLGNVYVTKRISLPVKDADKYISTGVAVEVKEEEKQARPEQPPIQPVHQSVQHPVQPVHTGRGRRGQ